MPAYYSFDSELNTLFIFYVGDVDDAEARALDVRVNIDVLFTNETKVLVDLSSALSNQRTPAALFSSAQQLNLLQSEKGCHNQIAIFAPSDINFGLARIWMGYAGGIDSHRIFRTAEEATEWLAIPLSAIMEHRRRFEEDSSDF